MASTDREPTTPAAASGGGGPAADRVALIRAQWARERPDLDTEPMGVIGRLHRLADRLDTELATVFTAHGLSYGEFDVLATLRRAGAPFELSPGGIAAGTMVTSGAVTKRVDSLVASGLVERLPDPDDGRARVVRLTARGLATIDSAIAEHVANEHRLLAGLAPQERATLADLLERWGRALGEGQPGR